jgi:hypothetical protein
MEANATRFLRPFTREPAARRRTLRPLAIALPALVILTPLMILTPKLACKARPLRQ